MNIFVLHFRKLLTFSVYILIIIFLNTFFFVSINTVSFIDLRDYDYVESRVKPTKTLQSLKKKEVFLNP